MVHSTPDNAVRILCTPLSDPPSGGSGETHPGLLVAFLCKDGARRAYSIVANNMYRTGRLQIGL